MKPIIYYIPTIIHVAKGDIKRDPIKKWMNLGGKKNGIWLQYNFTN